MTIPFNHMPVSTVVGASGTYTVPSGKYAQVTISMSISMFIYPSSFNGTYFVIISAIGQPTPSGGEKTLQMMLRQGDVLSFSASSASTKTITADQNGNFNTRGWISQATITAYVNSVAVSSARVLCGFDNSYGVTETSEIITVIPSVSSTFGFICSEYNALA
jgi:hypothetical protein